ncbi:MULTISPECIES: metallophosphoesterase family protein [Ramlibacter]|uniref:Metallophosphoesterase family protein n=1 Tax=Ramlibacter aquaticus TaxID=2780094 RepID=A0ABR9SAW3_9BURK|nr:MULTISPECIES: metallophosphoesterase family protein [Ramlibacter]MBE7939476.1 metallophosphoesterase family protein [Ramlibacter aquaticus]
MKLALLSDLHANLQALQACLADARARGATHHAFLGDLVGYGADPGPVLDLVMAHAAQGAWVLGGNHDAVAVQPPAGVPQRADQAGAAWTHAQLSPAQRGFLAGLPLVIREGEILMVHASADAPARWAYVDTPLSATASLAAAQAAGARWVFGGHVHEQRLFYDGAGGRVMAFEPTPGVAIPVPGHRRWLATVGSVGQPRDGRPQAMYALFDGEAQRLRFLRVEYDVAAAAQAIRRAGRPEADAARLARGR